VIKRAFAAEFGRLYLQKKEDAVMAETQLSLTVEERSCLVRILETTLKNQRIEEHRTRTPSYREGILHEEELLSQLLTKLGHPPK
jgi:hypothetical protein